MIRTNTIRPIVRTMTNFANDLTLKLKFQTVLSHQTLIESCDRTLTSVTTHNMHKARLSTAYAISFKVVLGEFRPFLADSDRHKQLGTQLCIDYK